MTKLISVLVLSALIPSPAEPRRLTEPQLHALVWCIQQRGADAGSVLPHFNQQNVRIRFHAGQYHPLQLPMGQVISADRDDEVRVGAYGPHERSLVIYDLFLNEKNGALVVDMGIPSRFSRKGNKWQAGDNPGGVATERYMDELVEDFSSQEPTDVPLIGLSTPLKNVSCVR
jgi:hypothetical protein